MAETGWPLIPREVLPAPIPAARIPVRKAIPQLTGLPSEAIRQLSIFGAETTEPSPADLAGLLAGPGRLDRMGGTARITVPVDAAWRVHVLVGELVRRGLVVTWHPIESPAIPEDPRSTPLSDTAQSVTKRNTTRHGQSAPAPLPVDDDEIAPDLGFDEDSDFGVIGRGRPVPPLDPGPAAAKSGAARSGAAEGGAAEGGAAEGGAAKSSAAKNRAAEYRLALESPDSTDAEIAAAQAPTPSTNRVEATAESDGAAATPRQRADGAVGDGAVRGSGEGGGGVAVFEVRTAYSMRLNGLARSWPDVAHQLFLSGPRLRLWTAAAGRPQDGGYALGLGAGHDATVVDAALVRAGLAGTVSDDGRYYLILGRKRLRRLAELVGVRPEQAPAELWPGGVAA